MIKSDVIDGIAVLTMQHGKANTLDAEFCNALAERFTDLRKSDAKAVVLSGQGRIFSAGVDLKRLSEGVPVTSASSYRPCTVSMRPCSFTRSRSWRLSTATLSQAGVCSPAARTGASWRETSDGSA
jgi:enoyl-CoA hydratase/carnithine racemase